MPIYEYRCKSCNDKFEVLQKFSDDPLTVCHHCGGELERLISPPTFQFKGTGWYVTDYGRASKGNNGRPQGSPKPAESQEKSKPKSKKTVPAATKSD